MKLRSLLTSHTLCNMKFLLSDMHTHTHTHTNQERDRGGKKNIKHGDNIVVIDK